MPQQCYFNSTIVRLKEFPNLGDRNCGKFQFYDSTIKSVTATKPDHTLAYFNSTIVRLKADGIGALPPFFLLFQFYDSTIKSECVPGQCNFLHKFQFYDSTIKSF